jgi:hypothetical protein
VRKSPARHTSGDPFAAVAAAADDAASEVLWRDSLKRLGINPDDAAQVDLPSTYAEIPSGLNL